MCGASGGACVNATDCSIGKSTLDLKVSTCATSCTGGSTCTADVTYTPAANYNGADSFTFTVNDGILSSAAATVSLTAPRESTGFTSTVWPVSSCTSFSQAFIPVASQRTWYLPMGKGGVTK